jgi:hypothetical protein
MLFWQPPASSCGRIYVAGTALRRNSGSFRPPARRGGGRIWVAGTTMILRAPFGCTSGGLRPPAYRWPARRRLKLPLDVLLAASVFQRPRRQNICGRHINDSSSFLDVLLAASSLQHIGGRRGMAKIKGIFGPQRRGIQQPALGSIPAASPRRQMQQPSRFGLNASGCDDLNQNTEISGCLRDLRGRKRTYHTILKLADHEMSSCDL